MAKTPAPLRDASAGALREAAERRPVAPNLPTWANPGTAALYATF